VKHVGSLPCSQQPVILEQICLVLTIIIPIIIIIIMWYVNLLLSKDRGAFVCLVRLRYWHSALGYRAETGWHLRWKCGLRSVKRLLNFLMLLVWISVHKGWKLYYFFSSFCSILVKTLSQKSNAISHDKEDIETVCEKKIYIDSVRTSRETQYVPATVPNSLMLFRETVAVYCENHTEHTEFVPHRKQFISVV
jgi:hypothetical protein